LITIRDKQIVICLALEEVENQPFETISEKLNEIFIILTLMTKG
jgi:hypothetical protein